MSALLLFATKEEAEAYAAKLDIALGYPREGEPQEGAAPGGRTERWCEPIPHPDPKVSEWAITLKEHASLATDSAHEETVAPANAEFAVTTPDDWRDAKPVLADPAETADVASAEVKP